MRSFRGEWGGNWAYDPAKQLGRSGGFASVYLGRNQDNGNLVAIKVIGASLAGGRRLDPRLRQREAEIATKIRGSGDPQHLIKVLDFVELKGDLLLVMQLAEASLGSVAKPVGEAEVLSILQDIAAGLRELHALGIIHRDLKPANILQHEGSWKLADFGIARDVDVGTGSPTFVGWGSVDYMAPELWQLQSPTVKTDLYALGCVTFELLSGAPPFHGRDEAGCRRGHIEEMPPPLKAGSVALKGLVMRLLNKNPADRPQDARDVQERLARIAAPLSPAQAELQRLAAAHDAEKAAAAATVAGRRAATEREAQIRRQAASDLKQICEDALALIQLALPGVILKGDEFDLRLIGEDAQITLTIWREPMPSAGQTDPLVVAGLLAGENRRHREVPLANIVSEMVEGRIEWHLCRFTASPLVRSYPYGPIDMEHGFNRIVFAKERGFMLRRAMHIWTMRKEALTPEILLNLYREAMALPAG